MKAMEKWARKLKLLINKRDALLHQLNEVTGQNHSYSSLKNINISDFKQIDAKIIFSKLQKAIEEYNEALKKRDEKMFGKFLDSLIHERPPTQESRNWCAYKY